MSISTNPVKGVGSLAEAQAKLLEPQSEEKEAIITEEPEQESPEEETPEAGLEDLLEDEGDEQSSEESEVGDTADADDLPEGNETPYHTIKYNGDEYEVTLEELKTGYQLKKDYTQKTQGLADEKKELDTLKTSLNQEREKYLQINQQLVSQQQSALKEYDKIDWAALKAEDPIGYVEKQVERQDAEKALVEQSQLAQRALTEQQAELAERMNVYVQEQSAVLKEQLPEWADPETQVPLQKAITEYASASGYTDQDINSLVNARDLIVLNKARMYDELLLKRDAVRKKKTTETPSIRIKSSTPQGSKRKEAKSIEEKRKRLRSSGKQQDAQALLLDMMNNPRKK